MSNLAPTTASARAARRRAVADVRRSLVLDAARETFAELGLEGASLRQIARRAGYTPGALYSYFDSKEAVYAALLGESLDQLHRQIDTASGTAATGRSVAARRAASEALLRARAQALFDFYRERPRDLDLGFYLFQGLRPRGLTPALDEALNAQLLDALAPIGAALVELGLPVPAAQSELTALFAQAVGLLLLGHTGRIRLFRQVPATLFGSYLDRLVERTRARPT